MPTSALKQDAYFLHINILKFAGQWILSNKDHATHADAYQEKEKSNNIDDSKVAYKHCIGDHKQQERGKGLNSWDAEDGSTNSSPGVGWEDKAEEI